MEVIEVLLTAFGGAAVALVGAWFLVGRLVDAQLSKAVERYKAELNQRSEVLKSELSIYASEQTVGLSRLDEQRSMAVRAIFDSINAWHEIILEITKPHPPRLEPNAYITHYRDLAHQLEEATAATSMLAQSNAILFSDDSYAAISRFGVTSIEMSTQFSRRANDTVVPWGKRDGRTPIVEIQGGIDGLREAIEEYKQVRSLLVSEFRQLLGASRGARSNLLVHA